MENNKLFIPLIIGTAREGRRTQKAADFMLEQLKETGVKTEVIDVRDYLFLFTENPERDELKKKLSEIVKKADGFVIVSPEYNHGYPGELKMMMDELYSEFAKKAAGICGVSKGNWGGARMAEQLKLVCLTFHMGVINNNVYFRNMTKFDNSDMIEGKEREEYIKMAKGFLEELLWFTKALKKAREKETKSE